MATTDAKPGFRLPWSADRGDAATPAEQDATTTDAQVEPTHDHEVETPAMIDAPASEAGSAVDPSPESSAAADADAETPTEAAPAEATPPAPTAAATPAPSPAPARKPNKLMADLTRAMQGAAEQAREESMTRLAADAKAYIESIHATSATEATELRRLADDDVAAIREWSKQEIARIREETESRISGRKGSLEREIEEHAAAIERRIERVQSRVASFEAEMADFFERLTAEQDPTRLAAMAETLPEPPSFDAEMDAADSPAAVSAPEPIAAPVAVAEPVEPVTETVEPAVESPTEAVESPTEAVAATTTESAAVATPWPTEPTGAWGAAPAPEAGTDAGDLFSIGGDDAPADGDPRLAALGFDLAAAEAEAAAFNDADAAPDEDIPTIADDALAARLAGLVPDADASGESLTTRVIVVGLVSVASIAGFKRHLSRVPGVENVGVSSGPDGEFVFAVSRGKDLDLNTAITTLPGFAARITGESDGDLHVTARDPESEG
jgi:hypothetical protein